MSADNFVWWKKGKDAKKPTRAEAELVIKDFFGAAMLKECRWGKDRFFVTLIGDWSQPLTHVVSKELRKRIEATAPEPGWEGRHLEVWLGDDSLDVMTRMQDEFTHVCARGLAAVFARYWHGRLEKD